MFNKKVLATFVGAALLAGAQSASADLTAPANADYDITLFGSCEAFATGTSFGAYPITAPDLLGVPAGQIEVTCDNGVPYRIMVDGGQYGGGPDPRLMVEPSTGAPMVYFLFDPLTGQEVGDGNPLDTAYIPAFNPYDVASGIDGVGTGLPEVHPLEADVLIGTAPAPGTYQDTVGITVTF